MKENTENRHPQQMGKPNAQNTQMTPHNALKGNLQHQQTTHRDAQKAEAERTDKNKAHDAGHERKPNTGTSRGQNDNRGLHK